MKNTSHTTKSPRFFGLGILSILLILANQQNVLSQSNPTPQNLTYSQSFGATTFTIVPTGTSAWTVASSPKGSQSSAEASTPNGNATITAATTAQSTGGCYGYSTSNNGRLYIQTSSNSTNGTNQLAVAIVTTNLQNIKVSYDIEMISAQAKTIGVVLQYRVGTSGSWTTISGGVYAHNNTDRSAGQVDNFSNLSLPAAANDNAVVQLRWATWRGSESGNSSGIGIDNISITGSAIPITYYFRSKQTGNWNSTSSWEMSTDNSTWVNATFTPNYNCKTITVLANHHITLTASDTVDQLVVNGTLTYGDYTGNVLTIHNETGIDLTINGTFEDFGPSSIVWLSGTTWEMGSNGTLLRTRSTSSNNWRDHYNSGISNIPSTANWIIRKTGGDSPNITSTGGMYYPNLTIENNTGSTWTTGSSSSFTGSSDYPRIKGNLDIGGNGTGNVSFMSENTNSNAVLVQGNLVVKNGSTLRNYGTGFEVQGDLIVNGTINYDSDDPRAIIMNGGNSQSIGGSGVINIYDLIINKTANSVTLSKTITADHQLTLTNGNIVLGTNDLILGTSAIINGGSFSSYLSTNSTGKIIKKYASTGSTFTFPTGDGTYYTPYSLTLNSATFGSDPFISIRVINSAEPHVTGYSDYINRFWEVSTNDITNPNADVNYSYVTNDITGNENNFVATRWNSTSNLKKIGQVNPATHIGIGAGINELGHFTAAGICTLSATISSSDPDNSICQGATDTLTVTAAMSYLWSTNEATQSIVVSSSGTYMVTLSDDKSCTDTASVMVIVNPLPVVDAGPDKMISAGQSAQIGSAPLIGNTYSWNPPEGLNDTAISNPIATPNVAMLYSLLVQDSFGCIAFDSVAVLISGTAPTDTNFAWCGYSPENCIYYNTQRVRDSIDSAGIYKRTTYACGDHFSLSYDDEGSGFDDPVFGQQRRDCACSVFQYIESIFHIPTGAIINILFFESGPILGNPNALAAAGPYWNPQFTAGSPGIYGGNVFEHITTGIDPDPNNNFDGHVQVNFSFNYASCNLPVGNCQYDLYSVILHEVLHSMGFLSLVRENSGTHLPEPASGLNQFSIYDWQCVHRGDINTPPLINLIAPPLNNPTINNAFGANSLRDGMLWTQNSGRFLNNQPVYSGNFTNHPANDLILINPPSLVSHLDGHYLAFNFRGWLSPGYLPHYVMSPVFELGETRREISIPEIRLLIDLGYDLNPIFAVGTTFNGVDLDGDIVEINRPPLTTKQTTNGNVPGILNSHYPDVVQLPDLTMQNDGLPWIIDLALDADIMDLDGDVVRIEPNTLFNIRGCGDGNNHNQIVIGDNGSGVAGTLITYTPRTDFIGRAQFGFYLSDGKERGSFMVYTVDVTPGPAFVNSNNPNTPVGADEIIVNGDCEQGTEVKTLPFNELGPYSSLDRGKGGREGEYFVGVTFPDAHPLLYTNYEWTSSYGNVLIRNSYKECSAGNYPASFGSSPFHFPPISLWFNPLPNNNTGDRYQYLMRTYNYFTLAENLTACRSYVLTLDVNFDNSGLPTGSIYSPLIGFTDQATHPNINYNFVLPTQDIQVTGGWHTISIPFYYCSTDASNFLNIEGNHQRVYIDNISLTEIPTLPLTLDAGLDQEICLGSSVMLTPSVNNQKCDLIFSWSPAIGLSCTNCENPIASPTSTTVYTVSVTDILGCEEVSDNVTVIVNPLPTANAGNDETICNGSFVQLTASGGVSCLWSPATGLNSTTICNPLANPVTTTTYTVTVTDIHGCTGSDDITVSLFSLPVVDAGPDEAICSGSSVQLNASGGISCSWSPATGLNSTTIFNPSANPAVTTTYTVTVTDANGCTATDDITVNVTILVLNPSVTDEICYGSYDGSIELTVTGGTSPYTYYWENSNGDPAGNSNPLTGLISDTYYVTVTDASASGCSAFETIVIEATNQSPWPYHPSDGTDKELGTSVAVDLNPLSPDFGNVYAVGYFQGDITFDGTTYSTHGNQDIYIVKFDECGDVLWGKQIGGAGPDRANKVIVDHAGNIIITGYFAQIVDFGGGNVTASNNNGQTDLFVAKYSPAGVFQWVRHFDGPLNNSDAGNDLAVDGSDKVYVVGTMDQGFFNYYVFVAALDPTTGTQLWYNIELGQAGYGLGITFKNNSSEIVVTGQKNGNIFVSKYDLAGNPTYGYSAITGAGESIIAGTGNNVYLAGYTENGNFRDIYFAQVDVSTLLLTSLFQTSSGTNWDYLTDLEIDQNGDVLLSGILGSPSIVCTIAGTPTTISNSGNGGSDNLVLKYSVANSWFDWVTQSGSFVNPTGTTSLGIAITSNGFGYVTGQFMGAAVFNNSTLYSYPYPAYPYTTDAFIARFQDLVNQGAYRLSTTLSNGLQFEEDESILIYPNPASNSFTVNLNFTFENYVSVVLYDAIGSIVERLFDGAVQAKSLSVDAKDLSTGNYFVVVKTDNNYIVKKILLVK